MTTLPQTGLNLRAHTFPSALTHRCSPWYLEAPVEITKSKPPQNQGAPHGPPPWGHKISKVTFFLKSLWPCGWWGQLLPLCSKCTYFDFFLIKYCKHGVYICFSPCVFAVIWFIKQSTTGSVLRRVLSKYSQNVCSWYCELAVCELRMLASLILLPQMKCGHWNTASPPQKITASCQCSNIAYLTFLPSFWHTRNTQKIMMVLLISLASSL